MYRNFASVFVAAVLLLLSLSSFGQSPYVFVNTNNTAADCSGVQTCQASAIAHRQAIIGGAFECIDTATASGGPFDAGGHAGIGITSSCTAVNTNTVTAPYIFENFTQGGDICGDATFDCLDASNNCDGSVTGKAIVRPVSSAQTALPICGDSSACQFTPTNVFDLGGGQAMVEYTGTANSCGGSDPDVAQVAAEQTNCVTVGVDTFCTDPDLADQNCGYLNDDYLCFDSVPDGNCTFYGNGNIACAANALSPPAPDDGITPGSPASPDNSVTVNGTTVNIYNSTSVAGSSDGPSGTQQSADPAEELTAEVDFTDIVEPEPDPSTYDDAIIAQADATGVELDGVLAELSDGDDFGQSTTLGSTLNNALGVSTSCSDIVVNAFGNLVTFECADAQIIRDVLAWILSIIFLIAIFDLVSRRPV